MPDPNLTTRINGVPFSWTSCAHFLNGLPYKGLTEVSWSEKREVKLVHAAQQDGTPLGLTAGIYSVENLKIKAIRDTANQIMQDMSVLGVGSVGDAQFPYMMQTYEPVQGMTPSQTLITGCRITGIDESQSRSPDELETEFTLAALYIIRTINGSALQLWSQVRSLL